MADDLGDKTELPTARKREQARERGQVAKSQDLAGVVELIAAVVALMTLGGGLVRALAAILGRSLENSGDAIQIDALVPLMAGAMIETVFTLGPILGALVLVAIAAHLFQTGPMLSPSAIEMKPERLDPIKGFAKLFDQRNLFRTLVNTGKLLLIVGVTLPVLRGVFPRVVSLGRLDTTAGVAELGRILLELLITLLACLFVLAVIDFVVQKWQHTRDLKMTKEEVRDERRSMDGDPAVRSRRLRMMRELALQRINSAVPKADVVVTNPTHFSVAIAYDQTTMRAPRVVAKGADHLAHRIRQVAIGHRVPIVERPPLARALYASVEVGQEISPEFYEAVAELLAYVYRLEAAA